MVRVLCCQDRNSYRGFTLCAIRTTCKNVPIRLEIIFCASFGCDRTWSFPLSQPLPLRLASLANLLPSLHLPLGSRHLHDGCRSAVWQQNMPLLATSVLRCDYCRGVPGPSHHPLLSHHTQAPMSSAFVSISVWSCLQCFPSKLSRCSQRDVWVI